MTDADALARFEAIVLGQQPASRAWEPVTDYSFETRKAVEGKHPELIREVFGDVKVWDAGCGRGHLVRLLRDLGMDALGFDPQASSSRADWREQWRWCSRRSLLDFELVDDGANDMGLSPRDLVICREVLEHLTLREICKAVTNLCALSAKFLYITTRFALAPQHFLDVMTSDDLDPTHISLTNQAWLRHLIVLEGFKRRGDLEQKLDWKNLGRCLVYERA